MKGRKSLPTNQRTNEVNNEWKKCPERKLFFDGKYGSVFNNLNSEWLIRTSCISLCHLPALGSPLGACPPTSSRRLLESPENPLSDRQRGAGSNWVLVQLFCSKTGILSACSPVRYNWFRLPNWPKSMNKKCIFLMSSQIIWWSQRVLDGQ